MKGLEFLEIRVRAETIQTTALLRSARILRRVLENWGVLLLSNSSGKLSANVGVKNSRMSKIVIRIIHKDLYLKYDVDMLQKKKKKEEEEEEEDGEY